MKQLLASQEVVYPRLFPSLQAAMKPLMARNKTGMESRTHRRKGALTQGDKDGGRVQDPKQN